MRFPKPIVYFGFFLIIAAVGAGIYDSFFKSNSQMEDPKGKARQVVAEKVIDDLFEKVRTLLQEEGFEVKDTDFEALKKVHKGNFVSKYLLEAQELERGKHSVEESLEKNEKFIASAINQLKAIYIRKHKPQKSENQP